MTTQDLDMDFQLITDYQEIKEILKYIGREDEFDDWGALLVKLGDGDYEEVYGTTTSVPRVNSEVTKLFPKNTNEGFRSRKRKLLENYVRKTVRRMLKEAEESAASFYFEGQLTFNDDEEQPSNRFLARNFSGTIGGDKGDIENFEIYDDGTFSGYIKSWTEDFENFEEWQIKDWIRTILMDYDENTNKIIDDIDTIDIKS